VSDPATGIGVFTAAAAGLISFLSPCVLPLVPGYLSAVVGVAPADLEHAGARRVLAPSLMFIASFSAIFIMLGLTATAVGSTLRDHQQTLEKVAAGLIVAMGLIFLLTPFVARLNREFHVNRLLERAGPAGPLVAGAAFAIAWTPCVGPTLGAILTAAALSQSAGHAAILLAFYSSGLAVPFLVTALAFNRMTATFARLKRHFPVIIATGGVFLIAMGVLIWTGELFRLNVQAQQFMNDLHLNFFNEV
jgi:cytochrome c-type biogenesis protein